MSRNLQERADIIRHLHSLGYRAYPLDLGDSSYGRGFAGVLGQSEKGACVFVVLKRPNQHLSVWQARWLLRMRSDGFLVFTARSWNEVGRALAGNRE